MFHSFLQSKSGDFGVALGAAVIFDHVFDDMVAHTLDQQRTTTVAKGGFGTDAGQITDIDVPQARCFADVYGALQNRPITVTPINSSVQRILVFIVFSPKKI